jgi:segregation and condensation protein A
MAEQTVPWWRKALSFALGGIRTGIGLFSRRARPEAATESDAPANPEENPEEEVLKQESPNSQTVGPVAAIQAATVAEVEPREEVTPEVVVESVEVVFPTELEAPAAVAQVPVPPAAAEPVQEQEPEEVLTEEPVVAAPDAAIEPVAELRTEAPAGTEQVDAGENAPAAEPELESAIVIEVIPELEAAEPEEVRFVDEPDVASAAEPEMAAQTEDKVPTLSKASDEGTSEANEAAERGAIPSGIPDEHPPGAKARVDSAATYGTTEVVPFQSGALTAGSSAGLRVSADFIDFTPLAETESSVPSDASESDTSGAETAADSGMEPESVPEAVAAVEPQEEAKAVNEPAAETDPIAAAVDAAAVELEGETEVEMPIEAEDEPIPVTEPEPAPVAEAAAVDAPTVSAEVGPITEPSGEAPSYDEGEKPAPVGVATAGVLAIVPALEEPVQVPEPPPAPAVPAKPQIVIKSRDNEADLSPFSVVVDRVYDGPLDLLLDLIRKQDIDIYDIPIAKITAQFLAYVNQLKAGDMDVAGEFIYIASLLIHIKSKMLLPRTPSGPDDVAEDPRRELVERLLEHERFKNAAQMLQQKQMLEAATWTNPGLREFKGDAAAEPEIAADTVDLVRVFRDILERARKRPVFNVDEDSVTVGQMIQYLSRRLTMEDKPVALRRLLSHTRSERALIAMFLALLELVRLQAVLLRQDRAFSEIFIKKHTGFDAVMNQGLANAQDDWR